MGFPAQLDQHDQRFPDDDTMSHFALREVQITLRAFIAITIAATAITMATFWFWAWVPAVVLLLAYIALIGVNSLERKTAVARYQQASREHEESMAHAIDPDADTVVEAAITGRHEAQFTPLPLFRKVGVIGVKIVVGVALAAIGLAFILLPLELALLGGVMFFFYMLFVMAPVWLGWVSDVEAVENGTRSNEHIPNVT
jgi:fatty acid desaturase